ncbi:MAG: 1-deoxy-D-xylulose-5-phosphate synthase [Gammaproteobacteria bacterium]|nr:1-deoxy-D-xylulose-5-phosphate synthase [Gammaproteobacteria bacterium]
MLQDTTTGKSRYPLLFGVDTPSQLRDLELAELELLAIELRGFLIEVTSQTGGHLAPGLGAVELTIALHYVFNTPDDRVVWDIGHQAYPHKILTGRRDRLHSIRQHKGLSGFLKRSESEFDTFGAGHASTSISAALGMAVASGLQGKDNEVVAVIGDGALTGGMAFEALNNAGDLDANLLVILNDNEMSISPNVGAISNYLARILSGHAYTTVREGSKTVLGTLPPSVKNLARRWEEHMKGMVMPSTLFEELGFYYIGPIDGHDLDTVVTTLKNMKEMKGPRFLHVVTQKGKGFEPAEGDPCVFHGVTPFNPDTGKLEMKKKGRSYTNVFSDWLCDMAERDNQLVGITPAMREGSGLVQFSKQYPDRYFDVGIAEQHALTFAAGLSCEGLKPVVAIYSTFLQRAYDQLIHDISIQGLDVLLAIDRAGLVGADGATHAGVYDYSFLRCVPDLILMAPADEAECRNMLFTGYQYCGPTAVRYPRGNGPGIPEQSEMSLLPIGKADLWRSTTCKTNKVAILAFGTMAHPCGEVAEKIDATIVNMRFVKPLDESLILELSKNHDLIVTVEENVLLGGAGSGVNECLHKHGRTVDILNIGVPDEHLDHGSQSQQLADCGLDKESIEKQIMNRLSASVDNTVFTDPLTALGS